MDSNGWLFIYIIYAAFSVGLSAKHKRLGGLVVLPAYAGTCDDPTIEVEANVTLKAIGPKVVVSGISLHKRDFTIARTVVVIRKCTSTVESTCEFFQTWRFGKESCQMIHTPGVWSGIFDAYKPPLGCPIKAGWYHIDNATIDASSAQALFLAMPIEKYFWRVRFDFFDHKMWGCIVFGIGFRRSKT